MTDSDLKDLLDTEAARINSPLFISDDPVQFPHRFSDLPDIELASLLSASIAWGNRKMICRDCNKLLSLMENSPYRFMMEGDYEDLDPEQNIHRTFFGRNLIYFLRGMRAIYSRYPSLQEFARAKGIQHSEAPAWRLVEAINAELHEANRDFVPSEADGLALASRTLPQNLASTALKRVNMALRWLVRNDGIVDLGVWDVITPAQLYIPLDVHVGNISRQLGLLDRKASDRKAVVELTEKLRKFNPDDPTLYDFALFGIGMKL